MIPQSWPASDATPGPGLHRTGDIGVASDWRDLSYDWTPILTATGVTIYAYLRDTYDQQRSLFPYLLPQGPLIAEMQAMLGKATDWSLRGPEYLLATTGLVQVEVGYGQTADPDHPQRTRVAYYTVGRLDHPILDWSMVQQVLDAVLVALAPDGSLTDRSGQRKQAQAALRTLGQAGFLHPRPDRVFWTLGAWPNLLPTLIMDERWVALFTHLHGADAVPRYRQQARAWVESAQRTRERLLQHNAVIQDLIHTAQRQLPGGPRGGSGAGGAGHGSSATLGAPATDPATSGEAIRVTQPASVADVSLGCRQAVRVTQPASATSAAGSHRDALHATRPARSDMSLQRDQLTSRCREMNIFPAATNILPEADDLPLVEPHLRDAELASTRLDTAFWVAVNQILYGVAQRYPHTPGEKKAAERRFKRHAIPTGAVLAALRAVMTLPSERQPRRFADALRLPVFHACLQHALALLPARSEATRAEQWPDFLQAYRTVGVPHGRRDVSAAEYQVLAHLFERHADACWEVLSRVAARATPVKLTALYLKAAVANNARAATVTALHMQAASAPCRHGALAVGRPDAAGVDARAALLDREQLSPHLLTPEMTLDLLQAWIDEADARQDTLQNRKGWLIWGIESGYWPADHPKLPPRPPSAQRLVPPLAWTSPQPRPPAADLPPPTPLASSPTLVALWTTVQAELARHLPPVEFDTWLRATALAELADGTATIATPNVFARDKLEGRYVPPIRAALQAILGYAVDVQVVIGGAP